MFFFFCGTQNLLKKCHCVLLDNNESYKVIGAKKQCHTGLEKHEGYDNNETIEKRRICIHHFYDCNKTLKCQSIL